MGDRPTGTTKPRTPSSIRRRRPWSSSNCVAAPRICPTSPDEGSARARREPLAGLGAHAHAAATETGLMTRSALTLRGLVHEPTRRDHGRGHHLAARGTRRRPQLGLPLLLAPRRRADRVGAGRPGVHRGGRGLPELGARRDRDAPRPPERLHPLYALDGAMLGPEAVIDSLPGYAGSAGAGRQRRQPPGPARRFRPVA